jgi:hypothetical protein
MWLDRFERVDGKLTLVGLEELGRARYLSPMQVYKARPGERVSDAITLRTSFRDWAPAVSGGANPTPNGGVGLNRSEVTGGRCC